MGMLIPPSLLMIVYGVLAEQSVGRMFIAGIIPGIILALAFCVVIMLLAWLRPGFMMQSQTDTGEALEDPVEETPLTLVSKLIPILLLMMLVLGGFTAVFSHPLRRAGWEPSGRCCWRSLSNG
ncbi:hypothetical protein HORIV_65650 [Vreelandella olivaria]|uniref:TRAP C4-dicarboxylate transport system permease DctM subunit domain-containing protein n=1 Tax=Vreelandella olivaria TaxID=390919 RepID=A0ABM7GSP6_9GAMM|nr:hypothetical protein HORIV_65650 [Halomonas olivaria]